MLKLDDIFQVNIDYPFKSGLGLLHRKQELPEFAGGVFDIFRVDHGRQIAVASLPLRSDFVKSKISDI
jgi:hypothetical protein